MVAERDYYSEVGNPILSQSPESPQVVEISPRAERFTNSSPAQLDVVAQRMSEGRHGAIAFNGIYGLFAHADSPEAALNIAEAKQRPQDKKLVLVSAPEYLEEHVNTSILPYNLNELIALQRDIHALGFILPASKHAPEHLVSERDTILSIWTEEQAFRYLMEEFRKQGGRAFVGTSANKSNQPTHYDAHEVWKDFRDDVDFVVVDHKNFDGIPHHRRKSTSVIDVTTPTPTLHRLGSVDAAEISSALARHNLPELHIPNEFKTVSQR